MRILVAVSSGWVSETLQAMGRNPDEGVRASVLAQGFRQCVVEDITGQAAATR
jgi:hypothetical protein